MEFDMNKYKRKCSRKRSTGGERAIWWMWISPLDETRNDSFSARSFVFCFFSLLRKRSDSLLPLVFILSQFFDTYGKTVRGLSPIYSGDDVLMTRVFFLFLFYPLTQRWTWAPSAFTKQSWVGGENVRYHLSGDSCVPSNNRKWWNLFFCFCLSGACVFWHSSMRSIERWPFFFCFFFVFKDKCDVIFLWIHKRVSSAVIAL